MTLKYATLYALREGNIRRLGDIMVEVAELTGQPGKDCKPGERIYQTCSSLLKEWRDRFGCVENSQVNPDIKRPGYWKITEAGIAYLKENPKT